MVVDILKRFGGVIFSAIGTLFLAYTGADPSLPVTEEVKSGWQSLLAGLAMLIPALENLYAEFKKARDPQPPVVEPPLVTQRRA